MFLPGVRHLQNIHPLLVHFPLAFLSGAALLYLLAWASGRESWGWTGFSLLVVGAVSAVAAAATGLYAAEGVMVARSVRDQLLIPHQRWMLTTTGLALSLAAWASAARPLPAKGRNAFLLLLVLLVAILVRGADYGGQMVYDYNAGGSACGQPIEFTH